MILTPRLIIKHEQPSVCAYKKYPSIMYQPNAALITFLGCSALHRLAEERDCILFHTQTSSSQSDHTDDRETGGHENENIICEWGWMTDTQSAACLYPSVVFRDVCGLMTHHWRASMSHGEIQICRPSLSAIRWLCVNTSGVCSICLIGSLSLCSAVCVPSH